MINNLQKINRTLLALGFLLANLLWIKALIDVSSFGEIFPSFSFPDFFLPVFLLGAVITITLSVYSLKGVLMNPENIRLQTGRRTYLLWLAIPVSVLCVSPVCYKGTIFFTDYVVGTIIRLSLLIFPVLFAWLYYRDKNELAVFFLLMLGLLSLFPNDQCYNPFNYRWVDTFGASPLTYLPTLFVILFSVAGLSGKNNFLILIIVYGLCLAALLLSLGHRLKIIW